MNKRLPKYRQAYISATRRPAGGSPRYDVGSTVGPYRVLKQTGYRPPTNSKVIAPKKQYYYFVRCLACGSEKSVYQNVLWYAKNRESRFCRACPPSVKRKLKANPGGRRKHQRPQPTDAALWQLAIWGKRSA